MVGENVNMVASTATVAASNGFILVLVGSLLQTIRLIASIPIRSIQL